MTSFVNETFRHAIASLQAGKAIDAERLFKTLLAVQPRHVAGLNLLGILLIRLGRFKEAEQYVRRALDENHTSDVTYYNYGIILKALGRPAEALERFSQALAKNASVAETWNNRGTVFNDLRRYSEAITDFDKAISIKSNYADAFCNKGKSLAELKSYNQSRGAYDRALELKPDLAEAWLGRGNVFTELKQYNDASAAYDKALALKPDLAEVWLGRGNVFTELKQYNGASTAYDKALALKPDLAEAWLGRGNIYTELKQYEDAFAAYDKALTLNPDIKYAEGGRLQAKLLMCDWTKLDAEISRLISAIRSRRPASTPFTILSVSSSPADQLKCASRYIADQPRFLETLWHGEVYSHDRIRIAYLSTDFRDHAIGYLTAGLFEHHDKSRFETTAISMGADQNSELRRRIKASFEHFIDVQANSEQQIAAIVRRLEIDIAVDVNGFTHGGRFNTFARRPAPIQVNYLGYPGTMGADYFDYIVADRTLIPENEFDCYTEKVVWLPDTYQANDNRRVIADRVPTRDDCGLPESGFVFCCFNNFFKIMPGMFDIWMRLLRATEGSVLWLLAGNTTVSENLRREAEQRGVAAERLIFAPTMPLADHLARHRQADLFLDTLPYNAHTTTSDALWAGLPVLTCLGSTFAGRVAASLLKAAGLPELITVSLEDYECLALKIAHEPCLLASLRNKLASVRGRCPLFNTERYTRHLEAAYTTMWERYQRGEAPRTFAVNPIQ